MKWSKGAYSVFWADRITIRRCMGCSPYFAATGAHPLLPLDIAEAMYLLLPPMVPLSMTDLIAAHAVALQKRHAHLTALHAKVMSSRVQAAVRFEQERVIPASLVILFAVSVTKVKCISRSKVLLQRQVKYITGSEKMK